MGFHFNDRVDTPGGPGTVIGFGRDQGQDTIDVELDQGGMGMFFQHEVKPMSRSRRSGGRRNPFNATKPAEWATMSKKLRKSWNRKHWRPEQYKCDLALKKEATRLRHRGERAGKGLLTLAEKMARSNPSHDLGAMLDRDPVVRDLLKYDRLASAYKRASSSQRMRILEKLSDVSERARAVRRSNPGHSRSKTSRARSKAKWHQSRFAIERERRKSSWSPDRRRIEREETASGFAVNPRRRR